MPVSRFALVLLIALLTPMAWAENTKKPDALRELVTEAKIPRGGDFMGFGFGALWIMSGTRLARIEGADNRIIDIPLKGTVGRYRGIAIGENAVWVPDVGADLIFKIDPRSNGVVATIPSQMLASEGSIGVGEGSLWVVTDQESRGALTRYNAQDGAVQATIPLPSEGAGVIVDYGSVWVTAPMKGELYRVDPKSNAIVAVTRLHSQPRFVTSAEGSIWVLNQGDGTIQRIDGMTGELKATIETGFVGGGGDLAAGGGYVWALPRAIPVARIDPKSNSIAKYSRGYGKGDAIRFGAGSLWISGSKVFRMRPPD